VKARRCDTGRGVAGFGYDSGRAGSTSTDIGRKRDPPPAARMPWLTRGTGG